MMMMRHVLLAFAVCANFAADAFSYHGSEECPSPPKVSVITDAVTNDGVLNDASKFWTLWREGAAAAAAEVDFRGFYKIELQSIDVQAYVDGIASACETADAIVVSVPFDAGTPDYAAADAAPERFSDYPNGWWDWGCSDTTGRICCCSEFQTSEIIHT